MCATPVMIHQPAGGFDDLEAEFKRVAMLIHEGKMGIGDIDRGMVKKMAQQLFEGACKGYGKSFGSELTPDEFGILKKIEQNVFVFSGFKNYQQLKEACLQLKDKDGKLKGFEEFYKDISPINGTYNKVYAAAEYSTAVASAQAIDAWEGFEENKEHTPNLTFRTQGADACPICAPMDDYTAPVDDPIWDEYMYPLHFFCECDIVQTDNDVSRVSRSDLPELKPMFAQNVGKTQIIFPDTCPYFQDVPKGIRKDVEEEALALVPERQLEPVYESEDGGGTVTVSGELNKKEYDENLKIGTFLADRGHNVTLLGISTKPGVKNPDALVDKILFEFKTNSTGTISSIDNELRRAKEQAGHILLNIDTKMKPGDLAYAIQSRANRSDKIKEVWLMFKGKLVKLDREQVTDKDKILKAIKKGR